MAFARTKIQIPRPRSGTLLARAGLRDALRDALLGQRVVLLCAAAGYGKSSALAAALDALPPGSACAWIGCDAEDTPAQLFECLVAALEPWDPPWKTDPLALLRADAEAPVLRQRLLGALINTLEACDVPHGVIAVDDLHRVNHPEVHAFLAALAERLGPRWTLAVASRVEPPLPLARLRAMGQLAEFRADALRFDADETRQLAAALGLDAALADTLRERADGWPAGLRLALGALASGGAAPPEAAIDRAAFDYMADEVIAHLPPALRAFLLASSVLPELEPARCMALTGDPMAAAHLAEVERGGLFVSRADGDTLRLHDLFRDALQAQLQREQPARLPALLRLAAATEPDPLRRIAWLQRAGDWDAAEAQLADVAEELLALGQHHAVRGALDSFVRARRDDAPRLQVVRALIAWSSWDWNGAVAAAGRAVQGYRALGDEAGQRQALCYLAIALAGADDAGAAEVIEPLLQDPLLDAPQRLRVLVAANWVALRGDQRRLAGLWTQIISTLQASAQGPGALVRWYECAPIPALVGLPGLRPVLQRYLDGVEAHLPEHPTPLSGLCQVLHGWLALWRGDLDAAMVHADAALDVARWLARPPNVEAYAQALRAVLLALRGDGAAAQARLVAMVDEIDAGTHALRDRRYRSLFLHLALRCAAIADDADGMVRAAARLLAGADAGWLSAAQCASAPAYAALAAGDLDDACRRWRELIASADWADLHGQVDEARLRLADALLRRGRPADEAAGVLRPLLVRAAADADWGPALMTGPATLRRLADAPWGRALDGAAQALLARWAADARALLQAAPAGGTQAAAGPALPAPAPAKAAAPHVAATPPPAPSAALSVRETEVLALIAAGASNKLIARQLALSPHTVKRHVANLLDKLALASRGEAAAWWHAQRAARQGPD